MAEIINLRQQRKAKKRDEKDRAATENRVKFGRTKAEKQSEKARTDDAQRALDRHRLTPKKEAD
jgi:hypothetical protein